MPAAAGRKTKKGGRLFALAASVASQVLALARNVVVARILGPQEFGLAAVIILTLSFLDSFSNASPHNLLFQAKDDEARPLMAAAHAVTISRAISTSLLLWASMGLVGDFFDVHLSPFALAAVVLASIASGFTHHGIRLVQRDGDFRLGSIVQVAADGAALATAAVVAWATHSHVAIAFALVGRNLVTAILSQTMSPQPYEVSWSRPLLAKFWGFGWPLLVNGPLLFFSAQADRMFITKELGVALLGVYTAVLLLVMSPSTAIMRWLGTTNIAALAKQFRETSDFRAKGAVYEFTTLVLVLGYLMLVGFVALGPEIVRLIYGHKFQIPALAIGLIGCLQTIRFLRAWPSALSLSIAANTGILVSTVIRLLALPVGYLGYVTWGGLEGLVLGLAVGEVLALLVSLAVVNTNAKRAIGTGFTSVVLVLVLGGLLLYLEQICGGGPASSLLLMSVFMLVGVPLVALSVSASETVILIRRAVSKLRARSS
jgi:O-antigen/teichoic acid export membrane protein